MSDMQLHSLYIMQFKVRGCMPIASLVPFETRYATAMEIICHDASNLLVPSADLNLDFYQLFLISGPGSQRTCETYK